MCIQPNHQCVAIVRMYWSAILSPKIITNHISLSVTLTYVEKIFTTTCIIMCHFITFSVFLYCFYHMWTFHIAFVATSA